jgi:hypothetical protein
MFQVINFLAIIVVSAAVIYHYYVFFETKKKLDDQISDVQNQSEVSIRRAKEQSDAALRQARYEVETDISAKVSGVRTDINATQNELKSAKNNTGDGLQSTMELIGQTETKINSLVDSSDKMEKNFTILNNRFDSIDNRAAEINSTFESQRNELNTKTLIANKVQIGNKFAIVSDKDDMLRLRGADGKPFGGFSFGKLRVEADAQFDGQINVNGGTSEHNQNNFRTIFNDKKDNKNYIRGDTEVRGNTNNIGDLKVGRDIDVNGTLWFGKFDESKDPMSIRKTTSKNGKSTLRMTVGKNADDSLEIWGDNCTTDKCSGIGSRQHEFSGSGDAYHKGNLTVDDKLISTKSMHIRGGNVLYDGGNNWLLHTPNDKRTSMWFTPSDKYGSVKWNWDNAVRIDADGTVNTKQICIEDVCINKNQLKAIKAEANIN